MAFGIQSEEVQRKTFKVEELTKGRRLKVRVELSANSKRGFGQQGVSNTLLVA